MSDSNFKNLDLLSVSIVKTIPKVSEEELFSHRNCYIGISLGNPIFQGKYLQAILFWAVERFEESLVVVGDHLCRFNERIFNGLNGEKAIQTANNLGDNFIEQTKDLFAQLPQDKIKMTRWKARLETAEYAESKAALDTLFHTNDEFMASVKREAFSFIERQTKHNKKPAVEIEEAIKLSCEYLLEEIAVFSALSEQGWNVELYPGPELKVLEDVARGMYIDAPAGLKKRINIELKVNQGSSNGL